MPRLTLTSSQAFVLTVGLLAGSSAATAAPIMLPAATISTQCESGQNGLIAGTASCSQAYGDGSDNVTATLLPFAGISTNAAVAGFVRDSYSGFATLDYSFEVVGGNPGDQVPLLIFSNLYTSIGGDAYAFSEIIVSSNSTGLGSVVACQSYGGTCPPDAASDFSGSFGVTVSSGALEDVHLEIEASTNAVLGAATSSASADPLIEINPSFANASDYSILLSPGVGNATNSTPEPGTLILIGCCGPFLLLARRYLRAERLSLRYCVGARRAR
ncbi:MAG: hypothetical protein ABSF22_16280 [Bryobacteraceae bacterium]